MVSSLGHNRPGPHPALSLLALLRCYGGVLVSDYLGVLVFLCCWERPPLWAWAVPPTFIGPIWLGDLGYVAWEEEAILGTRGRLIGTDATYFQVT